MHGNGGQGESSPNLRRQLNGYLALNVDPAICDNIERNAPVQGVEYGLHYGADLARATGHAVQGVDAGVESIAWRARCRKDRRRLQACSLASDRRSCAKRHADVRRRQT